MLTKISFCVFHPIVPKYFMGCEFNVLLTFFSMEKKIHITQHIKILD